MSDGSRPPGRVEDPRDDGIFPLPRVPRWGKASGSADDEQFLEGPRSRLSELLRAIKIFAEFIKGFRALHFVGPCVTVFGSARFDELHPHYAAARDMGQRLGRAGFTVMTGGGPGIMEAANRGAHEIGAPSIGCNILLPHEQKPNPYVDRWVDFHYFFVRKVMLVKYSYAFVAYPGGFGTLDEIFETLTLVQTGKIKDFPIVLVGTEYWRPLMDFLNGTLVREGTVDPDDPDRVLLTDSPDEAVAHIVSRTAAFGLAVRKRPVGQPLLMEKSA